MTLTYSKKENKRYRYYVCNNHLGGKNCESVNRTIVAGEIEKEVMKKAEQLYEERGEKGEEWSFGKQKEIVKKLIKKVMVKEDGIEVCLEDKVEFIPMKKKGKKCTVVEPEGIALFTIIRTDRNMLLACYSHKHISYRIRTIIRKAIKQIMRY